MIKSFDSEIAVLVVIFIRPEQTRMLLNELEKVKPKRLYVVCDGPRNESDNLLSNEVKKMFEELSWNCEVRTNYRKENIGPGKCVSEGISWFFENEEMGIIFEDDILPSEDFFPFVSEMLKKYKDDDTIGNISGCNYQDGIKRGDGSYYFSALTHAWGWATWRRVWQDYRFDLQDQSEKIDFKNNKSYRPFRLYWQNILKMMLNGEINTWDYQFAFLNLIKGRVSVVPNSNLISNIGFNVSTTAYTNAKHPLARKQTLGSMKENIEPSVMEVNVDADIYEQKNELGNPGFFNFYVKKSKGLLYKLIKGEK